MAEPSQQDLPGFFLHHAGTPFSRLSWNEIWGWGRRRFCLSCGTLSGLFDQDFQRKIVSTQTVAQRERCSRVRAAETRKWMKNHRETTDKILKTFTAESKQTLWLGKKTKPHSSFFLLCPRDSRMNYFQEFRSAKVKRNILCCTLKCGSIFPRVWTLWSSSTKVFKMECSAGWLMADIVDSWRRTVACQLIFVSSYFTHSDKKGEVVVRSSRRILKMAPQRPLLAYITH